MQSSDEAAQIMFKVKDALKAAAHEYWALGLPVVPLRGKQPLLEWARWQTQAQTEEEFNGLPWAQADGFAIICGSKAKNGLYFAVVDFDLKNLSPKVVEKGRQALKHLPVTQLEQSPSGGWHLIYFSHTKPKSISAYHNKAALELIGDGKLCIMSPSWGYRRLNDNPPTIVQDLEALFYEALEKAEIKVEKPPRAWFDNEDLAKQPYRGKDPPCIKALIQGVEEGLRNEVGIRLASYLLNFRGLIRTKTLAKLQAWNSRNKPPLPAKEVESILKSAEIHRYIYGCGDELFKAHCNRLSCPFAFSSSSPVQILTLALHGSETITIHPLIDYHPRIGLTIGAPLSNFSTHSPKAPNKFAVFLAEKPKLLPEKPCQNGDTFYTNVSLRKVKWLEISPTCKYKILLHSLRALGKGELEFSAKKEVFEKLVGGISKYWGHSDSRYYTLVACWAIATWFYPIFNHFPILNPQGQRRTGKTTLLEILRQVCWNPTGRECALREAGLFRTIQDSRPTYIMDITKLDPKNKNYIDVIDVCELGTERNGVVKRVNKETGEPITYEVYGPKAIASRTELPFVEKCIRIITEEDVSKTRVRHKLERDEVWTEIVDLLVRSTIKYWPKVVEAYESLEPTEKLQGRFFDYWAPILAVCKVFGEDKFAELLALAEEYAATQTFEDMISEVENAVLSVLIEYEGETLTITLKELTLKIKEMIPWINSWHHIKSALENLHVVCRKYSSSKGLTYQLNLETARRKARERLKINNNVEERLQESQEPFFRHCYVCGQPICTDDWRSGPETEYKPSHPSCFERLKEGVKNG